MRVHNVNLLFLGLKVLPCICAWLKRFEGLYDWKSSRNMLERINMICKYNFYVAIVTGTEENNSRK